MIRGIGKSVQSGFGPGNAVRALCAAALLLAAAATVAGAEHRSLDRPDRPQPPLLTCGPTVGGAPDWSTLRYGVSGSFLLRPDTAAGIFTPLFYWDTGLVVHGEYRDIAPDRNILTADLLLRRYVGGAPRRGGGAVLFVGAGGGLALVGFPVPVATDDGEGEGEDGTKQAETAPPETRRAEERYFSFVAELGYERDLAAGVALIWKGQWRNYIWSSRDYSNWSFHVQLGIPFPW
jgi:hypothetical protein